ncbi:uncharacterized protein PV09_00853 [Verruconis gallopava]|uniref:Probable 26S proteasome regulatory subunit p27 n=1 Tax=Verruconis gallopava TaxID=253628 RepID=A0A0D1Z7K7_9PEZI|nr:uncharacterized protein PV09_00853 [Verruconis gallopava]KIW08937.1 hypothetical protein PV09_00853 [Verruconis gallopava]
MGIPMEDIHTPSVASGPLSNGYANGVSKDDMTLNELMAEKDRLEKELKALSAVLDSHGVNMNTSLTTFDGYPRDDIDVPQIRTTRARIIHLKNDYRSIMSRLETAIHARFAQIGSQSNIEPQPPLTSDSPRQTETRADTPFAKVNSVVVNSPAADAGLQPEDKVARFGSATWLNHDKLAKVAQIVSQSEGKPIPVTILRGTQILQLTLTPRSNWGGRGMLGCHLVPL